jgi:glutathione synthase
MVGGIFRTGLNDIDRCVENLKFYHFGPLSRQPNQANFLIPGLGAPAAMNFAFVLDPLHLLHVYKDSTFAVMREAKRRGHHIFTMQQADIALAGGEVVGRATELELTGDESEGDGWYRAVATADRALAAFDLVMMRKDPPFDMEYIYSTYLLEHAERQGARVFNSPRAIRDHNEKFSIAEFPQFTVPFLVTRDADRLRQFVAQHGECVLKPMDGMGGVSIYRVSPGERNLNVIIENLTDLGRTTVMAQRFIPEISAGDKSGDKRILLIGGKVVPHCLARIPKKGETRGNLAVGGTGVARPLTPRDFEIAEALAPVLAARGLILVGLDVIGDYLTEINVTSPTGIQEITKQSGFDVAGMMVDALERAAGG